jgi:hypothetical protein
MLGIAGGESLPSFLARLFPLQLVGLLWVVRR